MTGELPTPRFSSALTAVPTNCGSGTKTPAEQLRPPCKRANVATWNAALAFFMALCCVKHVPGVAGWKGEPMGKGIPYEREPPPDGGAMGGRSFLPDERRILVLDSRWVQGDKESGGGRLSNALFLPPVL